MHREHISTAPFAANDRFDWYRETLATIGVSVEPPQARHAGFDASFSRAVLAPVTHMKFTCEKAPIARLLPQIRQVEWNQYLVYREFSPGAWFDYGGREIVTAAGDLIIADADLPFRTGALTGAYRHHAWLLPRTILEPHLPPIPRPLLLHIPAASGVAALVVAYLDALSGEMEALTEEQAALVADTLGRLIAVACGAAAGAHGEAVRDARLARARRHVDANLASPGLGPSTVAAALGMSVRQLHLVFEPSGESVGQYIRRRRLAECRAALESPLAAGRSVADIAFGWGFSSLPTFYRLFAQAYGHAPGDIRPRLKAS